MSLSKLSSPLLLASTSRLIFSSQQQHSKSTLQLFKSNFQPFVLPKHTIRTSQIQYQNNTISNRLIDKRSRNIVSRENYFSSGTNKAKDTTGTSSTTAEAQEASSKSIFKRFKDAYKQHGKVLIAVHIMASFGWIFSFFALAKSGVQITELLKLFEKLHIVSEETRNSILSKIENFNLEKFLRSLHFDYVLPDNMIKKAGELVTGETLKQCVTAVVLYKIFTPARYLLTLTLTKVAINMFKSKGIIPKQPPPGHSIKEMYTEKKFIYQKRYANQKERLKRSKQMQSLKDKLEKSQDMMKKKF